MGAFLVFRDVQGTRNRNRGEGSRNISPLSVIKQVPLEYDYFSQNVKVQQLPTLLIFNTYLSSSIRNEGAGNE